MSRRQTVEKKQEPELKSATILRGMGIASVGRNAGLNMIKKRQRRTEHTNKNRVNQESNNQEKYQ